MGLGSFGMPGFGWSGEGLFDAETLRRGVFGFVMFGLQGWNSMDSDEVRLGVWRLGMARRFVRVQRRARAGSGASRESWRLAICGERRLLRMEWVVLSEDMAPIPWYSMGARKCA
jgi:hypothetical protein